MKRGMFLLFFPVLFCVSISANHFADSILQYLDTHPHTLQEQITQCHWITESYAPYDMPNTYKYGIKGLELAEKAKDNRMISIFNQYIASVYIYRASYDTAFVYLDKSLAKAEEMKDNVRERDIYLNIANIYARQGKYVPALENYMQVLSRYDGKGTKRSYMLALGNIGEIYRRLNNLPRAIYYLEQQRVLAEEMNEGAGLSQSYRELGYVYFELGDVDKALEYELKVLKMVEGGSPVHESDCKEALARIYIRLKDYDKALQYTRDCLRLAGELGDPFIQVMAWNLFAEIYRGQNQYQACEEAALKAWQIDSTSVDTAPVTSYNIAYANVFLGNKEKAAVFFNKNAKLVRQKNEKSFHESMTEMEVRYETEKKELQIAALENEKKLTIWLGVASIAIFLLVLILLLIRHRLNIQKRRLAEQQVKQLEQEKQLIATQAVLDGETAERSRLARDLHDGLGGMLSVVKLNLTDMKSYAVLDQADINRFGQALEMLDQSISELRRVAHHIMPESLMRYGLRVSLEDFCRAIPGAHFKYLGNDVRLDSQLEVLLYRCTYELVNNAIKHANAANIRVQLIIDSGLVSLTVYDDGRGFNPETVKEGSGLDNIRARIATYNGNLNIYSSSGKGTEISIEIESADSR